MTAVSPVDATDSSDRLTIDPFGLNPNMLSRIEGVGGDEPTIDPTMAFHTAYHHFLPGPIAFHIQIEGLEATSGAFVIFINEFREDEDAKEIKRANVDLATLAEGGGAYRLTTIAEEDVGYAIHAQIHGETDARATAIRIDCDRRTDESVFSVKLAEAKRALFGGSPTGKLKGLVTAEPATLLHPVSQMCTAAQMDEPTYLDWVGRMNRAPHRHRKQWEFVYVGRALEYYGALQPGKRGLGFGVGIEPLPAVFAKAGCDVVATDLDPNDDRSAIWSLTHQHGTALADLRDPSIVPNEIFDEKVRFESADMTRIPAHFRDFDFCWSSCAFEHLGSIQAGLDFVVNSLDTLKPGGIAVHTTELNLTSGFRTMSRGDTVLFRKRDFERLALVLNARGHEVMPLSFDQGEQPDDQFVDVPPYCSDVHLKVALKRYVTTSFGIIVRKKP
ncbi:methyltransferase domain-containing protein [Sphingomonas naphthae]|uniref:Methyltransferase domain-containing protein n=1 Tax=Sphingomonas naphthae TaxID=1813468 RepID=A0ABY7TQS1_9SPHN|nr:methyltransferase domain-containing protein [Sphingomonas naphthae]WCT75336.1 methyltransferase domain-containing protein [Sphingomonas naphthae]